MKTSKPINLALSGTLLPPPPDVCQQCASDHAPDEPHNNQSLYWQYSFYQKTGGRWPTWRDAMAHCTDEVRIAWTAALADMGIEVAGSTPAAGGDYTQDVGDASSAH